MLFPGQQAARVRRRAVELLCKYLVGDLALVDEVCRSRAVGWVRLGFFLVVLFAGLELLVAALVLSAATLMLWAGGLVLSNAGLELLGAGQEVLLVAEAML